MRGEVGDRAVEERSARGALLVGQDLAVGQPGVIIDEGMDEVVAGLDVSVTGRFSVFSTVGTPSAAVGDLAQFLHVHVDELSRTVALVADRGLFRGPDHFPGDRIQLGQIRDVVAAQDP